MATFNRLTARLLDQADDTATTATTATASHTPPPPLLADADMATLRGLFTAPSRIDAFAQLLLKGGRPVVGAVRGMGGHCACLPAHAIEWVEVERMLEETAALVRQLCRGTT